MIGLASDFIQRNFGPRNGLNGMPLEPGQYEAAAGPLRVDPVNPRLFHGWEWEGDPAFRLAHLAQPAGWGATDPPPAFDYSKWLDFLQANHHNFFRLWYWEQAKWVPESSVPYYFSPLPYPRTGPGNALDGKPKFDLAQFNQAYFDRMRQRVIEAGNRGIYVSVDAV